MKSTCPTFLRGTGLVLLALLFSTPLLHTLGAPRDEGRRGGEMERRPMVVERPSHGSIRHADVGVIRHDHVDMHRNYDVEVNHGFGRFLGGFAAGAVVASLPLGYVSLNVGGVPYYYGDGAYYQQGPSGYVVVNPPAGAALPQPPPGSIPVEANGQVYYYLNGTFYVQQGNGFVIVPTPLGVTVPELPPGATQTVINGSLYYQSNGVYYQPVMQNGVTVYVTAAPQ